MLILLTALNALAYIHTHSFKTILQWFQEKDTVDSQEVKSNLRKNWTLEQSKKSTLIALTCTLFKHVWSGFANFCVNGVAVK